MSWLDEMLNLGGYATIMSSGTALTQRRTLNVIGGSSYDDAVNQRTVLTIPAALPVGTVNQLLQHDGMAWSAVSGISTDRLTSGTLPVARGGTGVASYTAGDLVYATAATTLAKLAIGDTGTVLTSSGTAPQWAYVTSMRSAVTLQPQLVVGPDSTPDYPGQVAITDDGGVAVAMKWSGSQDSRTGEVVQLAETWEIAGETVPGQITGLTLQGVTLANSTLGRVYITVLDEVTDTTVEILDTQGGNVLATGTQSGKAGGALTLVEQMGSGVSGSITLAAGCQTDATPYATLTANAVATFSGAPVGELGRPFAGVMYTNGASDGGDVWVVVAGKAKVLTYSGAAAGGCLYIDTARSYPDAGKADCELPRTTAYEDHGIGRALERVTSGLVLTQLDLRGFGPVQSA